MEARTEAESTLYRHLHRSLYTALLLKIEVSSVKTCGLIASTPLMVYLFLSDLPQVHGAIILLISKDLTFADLLGIEGEFLLTYTYLKLAEASLLSPSPLLSMGRYVWLLPGT